MLFRRPAQRTPLLRPQSDMERNRGNSANSAQESSGTDSASVPVIPLPTPDQGQPIQPDDGAGVPVIPLPTPDQGQPIQPDDGAGIPVIPLPNPGEGGPTCPGPGCDSPISPLPIPNPGGPLFPGGIQPLPGGTRYASARFLNAAFGYPAFRIFVGGNPTMSFLSYGSISGYSRVNPGYRTVTVSGTDGYIYMQKTLPFEAGGVFTVAVINRAGGLDLLKIPDICCSPSNNTSNFRVSNLALNSGALDVLLADGRVIYADVRFKETTSYKRIAPGAYEFLFSETNQLPIPAYTDIETLDSAFIGMNPLPSIVASLYMNVRANTNYTVFILQNGQTYNAVGTMVVADR